MPKSVLKSVARCCQCWQTDDTWQATVSDNSVKGKFFMKTKFEISMFAQHFSTQLAGIFLQCIAMGGKMNYNHAYRLSTHTHTQHT